jgi:hypothetical protein
LLVTLTPAMNSLPVSTTPVHGKGRVRIVRREGEKVWKEGMERMKLAERRWRGGGGV